MKCAHKWSVEPVELSAKWCKFTPEFLQLFNREGLGGGSGVALSAVAFYYARELYLALDVPVGIVDASWGGTSIDAWIENLPETPPSSRDEGLRLLHGLEANLATSLQTPQEA